MIGLLGLALIGLTLYVSTLTFSLRAHSRSRLSSHLTGDSQREWLNWLDRHEIDLLVVTAFTRVGLSLGLLTCVAIWLADSDGHPFNAAYVAGTILISLGLLLVFAIAIPNALSRYVGELILAYNLRVLQGLRLILRPIAYVAQAVDFVVMRLLGKSRETDDEESERLEREILNAVSEGEAHGAVDEEQADMIESVMVLERRPVRDLMTPRADMVMHQGDFDYGSDPDGWDEMITNILGLDFPYFASVGNHDTSAWSGSGGYQAKLQARLDRIPDASCSGELGVKSACTYKGLFFILSGEGTVSTSGTTPSTSSK